MRPTEKPSPDAVAAEQTHVLDETVSPAVQALAARENAAERQRRSRASRDEARAVAAMAPNPGGYVVPRMPRRIKELRAWIAEGHDAYSRRQISPIELMEMRRSMTTLLESYKVQALTTSARAATRQALATEQIATTITQLEHGNLAAMLFATVQNGQPGASRRRVPWAQPRPITSGTEGDPAA